MCSLVISGSHPVLTDTVRHIPGRSGVQYTTSRRSFSSRKALFKKERKKERKKWGLRWRYSLRTDQLWSPATMCVPSSTGSGARQSCATHVYLSPAAPGYVGRCGAPNEGRSLQAAMVVSVWCPSRTTAAHIQCSSFRHP